MTHVSAELKSLVEAEVRRCIDIAEAKYDRTFKMPKITYKKRGTTAGTANDNTYTINLNAVLLIENGIKFIDGRVGRGTVTHEFAHLVDGIVNPETRETGLRQDRYGNIRRGKRNVHGTPWKNVMRLFGVRNPTRCHDYDVSNSRVKKASGKKHVWACGCGEGTVVLTNYKHARQLTKAHLGYGVYSRGHTPKRCGVYTYKGTESNPVATPKAAPKPVKRTTAPKKGTKLETAVNILREFYPLPKEQAIPLIQDACGMSKAGATTYYYNANKVIKSL